MELVLVILLALALALGLGYALKHIRIEKVAPQDTQDDTVSEKYNQELEANGELPPQYSDIPAADSQDNPFDYFSDLEPEPPAAVSDSQPVAVPVESDDGIDYTSDKLCGFKTGRGFLADCQKVLSGAQAENMVFGMACFDFDRFRFINSLKGQSIGDYALSRMAQEMRAVFPDGSLHTRLSADHFLVLFPLLSETSLEDHAMQIKRITDYIREDIGVKSGLRISMGVALTKVPSDYDAMLLLQRANIARHCMKTSKEAIYSEFDPAMIQSNLFGESALEDYKENQYDDDILMVFQPMASLNFNKIAGSDVLARWVCEEENFRDTILNADNGRIPTNNMKIIYNVCRWRGRWQKASKEVPLSFLFLPTPDLFKEDIDAFFGQCLHDFQADAKGIVVQVDQSTLRLDWPTTERQLQKLRDIGLKTAICGIDRSFNSLEFLAGLPLDFIKFHQSVASSVERNQDRVAHVTQLIANASQYNCQTIFEGVSNQEQANILRKLGANIAQGRYAGAASSPEDYARSLQEYVVKQTNLYDSTTILDDHALSKGEFHVY